MYKGLIFASLLSVRRRNHWFQPMTGQLPVLLQSLEWRTSSLVKGHTSNLKRLHLLAPVHYWTSTVSCHELIYQERWKDGKDRFIKRDIQGLDNWGFFSHRTSAHCMRGQATSQKTFPIFGTLLIVPIRCQSPRIHKDGWKEEQVMSCTSLTEKQGLLCCKHIVMPLTAGSEVPVF